MDSGTRGVNFSKSQYKRAISNTKHTRHIREVQLWGLIAHVKMCGDADVIITGDFNESAHLTKTKLHEWNGFIWCFSRNQ